MAKKPSSQLAFSFGENRSGFVFTRPLARHRYLNGLVRKLHYVRRFFPELDGKPIKVGLTRAASGMAVPGGDQLWINPAQTSYHTLTHEFVHLLQGTHGVPAGERSCDVFALARHWTLIDSPPYYVRRPVAYHTTRGEIRPGCAMLIYSVARRAVDMRKTGLRNYIAYFEKALKQLKPEPPHAKWPGIERSLGASTGE